MNIPKSNLEFLNQIPNYFDYSQPTIDAFKIDEYDRENVIRTMKLLLHRMKHISVDLIARKVENNFDDIDFTNLLKYPLPAIYNIKTKRVIINLKFFGKKEVTGIDPRSLYSVIFYGYMLRLFYHKPLNVKYNIEICDYLLLMFINLFGKKYGIMSSYKDMIPKLHFLIISYVMTSFFGHTQKNTYTKSARSGASIKDFRINLDEYDLYNSRNFIKALSDSGVFPGFDLSYFAGYIFKRFGLMTLPMFEDESRFIATMAAATLPSGGVFPRDLQKVSVKIFDKIVKIVEPYI